MNKFLILMCLISLTILFLESVIGGKYEEETLIVGGANGLTIIKSGGKKKGIL
jgi:hypothetical protein